MEETLFYNVYGRYQWLSGYPDKLIGSGTFGEVVTCRDDESLAFKIFRPTFETIGNAVDHVVEKIEKGSLRNLLEVNHANVVEIIGVSVLKYRSTYKVCFIMKNCQCNLQAYLREKCPNGMEVNKVRDCAIQIASGLSALRDNSLYHIDIKPENILVGTDNRFKLSDLEDIRLDTDLRTREVTRSMLLGTQGYMAPELKRARELSQQEHPKKLLCNLEKCCMYSFGVVLCECLLDKKVEPTSGGPDQFLKSLDDKVMYRDLTELLRHMLVETPSQRACLDEVCFSKFFIKALFPQNVEVIGNIEFYREHTDDLSTRCESSLKEDFVAKSGDQNYIISYKNEMIRFRSTDEITLNNYVERLTDFLMSNPKFNTKKTKVVVMSGSHGSNTQMELGFNQTALTNAKASDSTFLKEDKRFFEGCRFGKKHAIKIKHEIINLPDFHGKYLDFIEKLEQCNIQDEDIFLICTCHGTNTDILKLYQCHKNLMELKRILQNQSHNETPKVVSVFGTILEDCRFKGPFPWEELIDRFLLKQKYKNNQDLPETSKVYLNIDNFVDELANLNSNENPKIVLLSFSVFNRTSLTAYLNKLSQFSSSSLGEDNANVQQCNLIDDEKEKNWRKKVPRSVLENDWKRVTNYLLPTHDEISLKYADLFLYTNVEQCGNEGVCKRQITVLHKAVRNGDINTMKILVRQNRSILNQADEFGWVPLHFASVLNRLDAVSWLLNQPGIDTDKRNNFGNMPDDDDFLRWPWFDYSVIKTLIREHRRKSRQRRITL